MTDTALQSSPVSGWKSLVRGIAAWALLTSDGYPRKFAQAVLFKDVTGRPRWPLSRILFRKNGLARPYLDGPTRSFLEAGALSYWVRRFDTPEAEDLARMAASADDHPVTTFLVELDERLLAAPEGLARALSEVTGLNVQVRLLLPREPTDDEAARLTTLFGEAALDGPTTNGLSDSLLVLLAGALPRPHGPRLLVDALCRRSAALAYGDEAGLLPYPGLAHPWFKPPSPSPILAAQGTLVGRMVALHPGRTGDGAALMTALLSPGCNRREVLARLAADLADTLVAPVPHVCLFNTRPADPPLPAIAPPLPDVLPFVSVIIPNRDSWWLLEKCLASLAMTDWPSDRFEIIVVDNGSTETACLEGLATAEAAGQIRVIRYPEPFNYSRINNIAAAQARGTLLVLLNNDTEALRHDWLRCLAAYAVLPRIGAVGTKLLYDDRTVQHGGVVLGMHGGAVHDFVGLPERAGGYQDLANLTRETSAVTAACMAIRKDAFEAIGGFNESFAVAFNDVALCCDLLAAGLRNCYVAEPLFLHHESKTRGHNTTPEKRKREEDECLRAIARHPGLFAADPFYSPNLSLDVFYKPARSPRRVAAWKASGAE